MVKGESKARSELTRQRIVEATIDVLVDAGFANTTMRSVAARATTSVGAVQYHFPSKQALLLETLTEIFQEGIERLSALAESEARTQPRAHRIVRSLWAFYSGRRYLAASEILLGTRKEPDASRPVLRARDLLTRTYQTAWDLAVAGSPLPSDQRLILLQLTTSTLRGLGILAVHESDPGYFEPQLLALEGLVEQALASGSLPQPAESVAAAAARPRRFAVV